MTTIHHQRALKRCHRRLSRWHSCAGMSLVEVVVSSAILALAILTIFATFSYARRAVVLTEERLASMHIARHAMERLRNYRYDDTELSVGTRKRPLPGYQENRGYYSVTEDKANGVKTIRVVVEWVTPWQAQREVELSTMMSRTFHE